MRKIISLIIISILLVIVVSAATPTVRVSNAYAKIGDTVKVTVSLENNPGIINLKLKVSYDRTALTLIKVEDAGMLGDANHPPVDQATYPYTLTWSNDTAAESLTANGTLVTLTFKVLSTGYFPITITYGTGYIYDYNLKPVSFTLVNGAIIVYRPWILWR